VQLQLTRWLESSAVTTMSPTETYDVVVTSDPAETPMLGKQLVDWGIAPDRIVLDGASRNTHDNAVQSAKILRAHGWSHVLLVTSALHMPRAAGCFRAEGVAFDTLAVDRLTRAPAFRTTHLDPRADAFSQSTAVLREGLGRIVYRVVGYAR
jgi:uncharacterized SAM-binding protein YcdF (DUF218 family)